MRSVAGAFWPGWRRDLFEAAKEDLREDFLALELPWVVAGDPPALDLAALPAVDLDDPLLEPFAEFLLLVVVLEAEFAADFDDLACCENAAGTPSPTAADSRDRSAGRSILMISVVSAVTERFLPEPRLTDIRSGGFHCCPGEEP